MKPKFEVKILNKEPDEEFERTAHRAIKRIGVYVIKTEDDKKYVGSSGNLNSRLNKHKDEIKTHSHRHKELNGKNVTVDIIETPDRDSAYSLEQKFLDGLKQSGNLLNVAMDARNPGKGLSPSDFSIQRIKETHTGKIVSEETRQKLSQANTGKTLTEERKQHLREINTGKIVSEETRKKISEIKKGHVVTEETAKKISDAKKGKGFPYAAYEASMEVLRKPVEINGITYNSRTTAAKALGVTDVTIKNRIKNNNFPNYKEA